MNNNKISSSLNTNENKIPTKVFALGGLEEIGKNTYCIEHDDEIIIIDAGVKFPNKNMLGVNAVIPDYSYLIENNSKIKALFITHGHEDHIGGISYLIQQVSIPIIYAPKLATALIRDRLSQNKLDHKTIIKEVDGKSIIKSKHFKLNYVAVNHSIPDAFGIFINTPNGLILNTGDYKFDWTPLGHKTDIEKITMMGANGIKLLMADSTNAEISGYTIAETEILKNVYDIFINAKGRIFFSTFASNVHRIRAIIELGAKLDRKIAIFGRSIDRIIRIIKKLGTLSIDKSAFIKSSKIKSLKDNKILIVCTGSQGEELAALSRMANNTHREVGVKPGDTIVLSSSPIPGNHEAIETVVNKMIQKGAIVKINKPDFRIHTSGHASQEEQKLLFTLTNPTFFMPIHGDYRMLKEHAKTACAVSVKKENVFICANGDQLNLLDDKAWIGKRIKADPILVDGNDLSGQTTIIIRDRLILAKNGLIAVIVCVDSKTNTLVYRPKIIVKGSFFARDSNKFLGVMINIVSNSVNKVLKSNKPTFSLLKKSIKENLQPYVYAHKRRNPIIVPLILSKK